MPYKAVSYEEWRRTITREVESSITPGASSDTRKDWLWVIDGSAHPDLPGILWDIADNPDASPLFMNTYVESAAHKGPWFLPCTVGSPVTEWIFNQLAEIPLGILFSVEKGRKGELFDHLQNIVECSLPPSEGVPSEKKFGIFRFYDARILYGLSTCTNRTFLSLVKGPALSVHAWEPGRAVPVTRYFSGDERIICSEPVDLSREIVDHLWQENMIHSIVGTLGGLAGDALRKFPIDKAYEYVSSIRFLVEGTVYNTRQDIGFATAYAILSPTDTWQSIIEHIKEKKIFHYPLLSDAYTQASQETGIY